MRYEVGLGNRKWRHCGYGFVKMSKNIFNGVPISAIVTTTWIRDPLGSYWDSFIIYDISRAFSTIWVTCRPMVQKYVIQYKMYIPWLQQFRGKPRKSYVTTANLCYWMLSAFELNQRRDIRIVKRKIWLRAFKMRCWSSVVQKPYSDSEKNVCEYLKDVLI